MFAQKVCDTDSHCGRCSNHCCNHACDGPYCRFTAANMRKHHKGKKGNGGGRTARTKRDENIRIRCLVFGFRVHRAGFVFAFPESYWDCQHNLNEPHRNQSSPNTSNGLAAQSGAFAGIIRGNIRPSPAGGKAETGAQGTILHLHR